MRVLLIAPPGAGKGTQGTLIASHFGSLHIATGDLLREHVAHQTPLGLAVSQSLSRGELVSDDIVLEMVRDAMVKAKEADRGYVLDGMPRTIGQARALYAIAAELGMLADVSLYFQVSDDEVVRRLLARALIEHRTDDTEDVIRRRLALYHEVTHPIVDWYRERGILVSVNAMRPAEDVGREILSVLEVMRAMIDHVPTDARRAIDLTGLDAAFGASRSG